MKLAWDGIVDVVTGAIQVVVGIIRGFGRTLYNLGREAWYGFLSGFRQGAPEAEKAGKQIGDAAHRGARQALEAHSPSRVMQRLWKDAGAGLKAGMQRLWKDAGAGLKAGMDESGALASAAGRSLAARAVEATKGRLKEGASEIKREAKALAEELAREMAAIRLLRAGKPPEVARAREQYPRQPMARVGELVGAQAKRERYEELFQAIRQAKRELADLERQLAGMGKQEVIRQVFAGLSPELVERLARLTGQTEAARARLAALAEEQQRARQVADAYAGSIGDLSDRINEHLVALGKLSEVEALTARLARQGWTREQIQDYANLQRIEETVRLAAEARADAERKAQEAARQAAQEAADRMRRYADALAQVRAEIAGLQGDPMPLLRLEIPGVADARLRELLALRQQRARLEEQIAARARAETEARREEEKSANITRRLKEELADAEAAYRRVRDGADPYLEVLARLNLATRDLTEEQRGLAQQIADTIVQAEAVQRARRAWGGFPPPPAPAPPAPRPPAPPPPPSFSAPPGGGARPELFVPRSAGAIAPAGVTVQMTVVTPDAESFRRSQGQIMTDIWRQARLAAARTG